MKKRKISWFKIGLLSCCVMLASYQTHIRIPTLIEQTSSYLVYPLVLAQQKLVRPVQRFFEQKKSVQELEQQLIGARTEQEYLRAENIALHAQLQHVASLQELLDFKEQYEGLKVQGVQVIARNISQKAQFFLIDAGSQKGIKKNMVALYKNGLLGRVDEVYPWYSKVVLITDRSCKIAATCAQTQAAGILEGCNERQHCLLNRVSHLEKVHEHDMVLSSGQGLIFPKGFGLGTIKTCKQEGLTYHIDIEPLFDLSKIDYCYIAEKGVVG